MFLLSLNCGEPLMPVVKDSYHCGKTVNSVWWQFFKTAITSAKHPAIENIWLQSFFWTVLQSGLAETQKDVEKTKTQNTNWAVDQNWQRTAFSIFCVFIGFSKFCGLNILQILNSFFNPLWCGIYFSFQIIIIFFVSPRRFQRNTIHNYDIAFFTSILKSAARLVFQKMI